MTITNNTMNIAALSEEKQKIVSTIIENGGYITDTYRNDKIIKIDGLVVLGNGEICPTFQNRSSYWGLNSLYFCESDGQVRLSIWSAGVGMKASSSFEKSVQDYNESVFYLLESQKIVGYIEF